MNDQENQTTEAQQQALQQTVNLTLPVEAVNVVLQSLGKQPFDTVADLIIGIRAQAISQLQQAQADKAVEVEVAQ